MCFIDFLFPDKNRGNIVIVILLAAFRILVFIYPFKINFAVFRVFSEEVLKGQSGISAVETDKKIKNVMDI